VEDVLTGRLGYIPKSELLPGTQVAVGDEMHAKCMENHDESGRALLSCKMIDINIKRDGDGGVESTEIATSKQVPTAQLGIKDKDQAVPDDGC
jgi:hypothetical protein